MLNTKRLIVISYDFLAILVAWLVSYWIRANLSEISIPLLHDALLALPIVLVVQAISLVYFGLYRGEWRFASIPDMVRIIKAVVVGALAILFVLYFIAYMFKSHIIMPPRSILPLYSLLLVCFLGGARLFVRWFKDFGQPRGFDEKVLIVGAGLAGESLVRELRRDHRRRYFPAAFADDSSRKQGSEILGVRVRGKSSDIPQLVKQYNISQVLIAIPSANSKTMRRIVELCNQAEVSYRTLPGLSALVSGEVTINDLRPVSLEDLLGREPIDIHEPRLTQAFKDKKVLVTGGGGSIGSELCRQIAVFQPKELIIIDHSEFNLYEIEWHLRRHFPELNLKVYLQNITEEKGVTRILSQYKPEIVFHAAAYKHVPMLEQQALMAVHNNIIGTKVVAEAAVKNGVKKFILVSTDKAVNPTNIMGASKRIAELFCQNLNQRSDTKFITVRFGNVLGSAGSVIPLFRKQLEEGGPLTITHPDITRYFMTIPEASQLILHASLLGSGGEIFVLDMGEPIKIVYLAEQMIKLSGKKLGEDIDIEYIGLRPGEKLYEELFHDTEALQDTSNDKIFKASVRLVDWVGLLAALEKLERAYQENATTEALKIVTQLVPEAKLG